MKIAKAGFYRAASFAGMALLICTVIQFIFFTRYISSHTSDFDNYRTHYTRFSISIWPQINNVWDWILSSASFHFLYEWLSITRGSARDALLDLSLLTGIMVVGLAIRRFSLNYLLPLAFLAHPRFIDLVVMQQRNALALAIFMLAFQVRKKLIKIVLIAIAISVHLAIAFLAASLLLYFAIEYLTRWTTKIERFIGIDWRRYSLQKVIGIVFAPFMYVLTLRFESLLNLRGVGIAAGGQLYLLMWILTALWILYIVPSTLSSPSGYLFYSSIALASTGLFYDLNTSRIISIGIPFLVLAISGLSIRQQAILSIAFIPNIIVSYYFWL